jgi:ATP-dependent Lon protease
MSKDNEKDLADVPEEVREDLTIHLVESVDEVLKLALQTDKSEEILEVEPPPPVWSSDSTTQEITLNIE